MGCIFDDGVHFSNQHLLVIIQQLPDTFDTFPLQENKPSLPGSSLVKTIATFYCNAPIFNSPILLYNDFIQSAKGGELRLNDCPICKRLVCSRCFLLCDDLDICKQCAAHLEETGSPVLTDVLETTI